MQAILGRPDVRLVSVGVVPDNLEATSNALAQVAQGADLVVTTGGVSVGEEDHLPTAIANIGGSIEFSGVAIGEVVH